MSSHYDRSFAVSQESLRDSATAIATGEDAIEGAAEALREVEVEAAQSASATGPQANAVELDAMSIDELRELAASLEVPNRAQIVERDELADAIRARL